MFGRCFSIKAVHSVDGLTEYQSVGRLLKGFCIISLLPCFRAEGEEPGVVSIPAFGTSRVEAVSSQCCGTK